MGKSGPPPSGLALDFYKRLVVRACPSEQRLGYGLHHLVSCLSHPSVSLSLCRNLSAFLLVCVSPMQVERQVASLKTYLVWFGMLEAFVMCVGLAMLPAVSLLCQTREWTLSQGRRHSDVLWER
jgi:hypothetical protein